MNSPALNSLADFLEHARTAERVDPVTIATRLSWTLSQLQGAMPNELDLESASGQALLHQLTKVLDAAYTLSNDESRTIDWLVVQPLKAFGPKTPLQLVVAGESAAVIDYLKSIESGASG